MKKLEKRDLIIDSHSPSAQFNEEMTTLAISTGNNLLIFFSQHYKRLYDVGIVEWRIMRLLAKQPNLRLVTICNALMADKSGMSRALSSLQEKRLVKTKDNQWNKRSKFWQLTPAGYALNEVIAKENNKVSEDIMVGIPTEHALLLRSTFQKLNDNIEQYPKIS